MSRLKPPPRVGTPAFRAFMAAQSAGAEPALLETLEIIGATPAAEQPRRKIGPDMSAQTDAFDAEILARLVALGPGSHARKALDGADDPAKVRASLSRLVDAGKVLKIGRKKGTRYALPAPEETPAD